MIISRNANILFFSLFHLGESEPVRAVFKSTTGIFVFKSMIPIFLGKTCPISPSSYSINFELNFPRHRNVPRSDPFFTSCSVCRIRTRTTDGFIPATVERTSYRKVNRAPRRSRIDLFQIGIKSHHEIIKENSSPPHALTRALVASMDRLPCLVSDFQKIYTANV